MQTIHPVGSLWLGSSIPPSSVTRVTVTNTTYTLPLRPSLSSWCLRTLPPATSSPCTAALVRTAAPGGRLQAYARSQLDRSSCDALRHHDTHTCCSATLVGHLIPGTSGSALLQAPRKQPMHRAGSVRTGWEHRARPGLLVAPCNN